MAIFATSDMHFGHDREFVWKVRGFNSIQEMNDEYVNRWNSVVNAEDDVYCLGDLMLGDPSNIEYIKKLNGKIHIVYGNHDTNNRRKMYAELPNVVETAWAIMLDYKKYHFFMTHFPCLTGNLEKESLKQCTCNLFGHTHQTTNFYNDLPFMYHVGVDSHNGYPVSLDIIIEQMNAKVRECRSYLDEEETTPAPVERKTPDFPARLTQKEMLEEHKATVRCDKCVYSAWFCGQNPTDCHEYRRDPPDGGYYG